MLCCLHGLNCLSYFLSFCQINYMSDERMEQSRQIPCVSWGNHQSMEHSMEQIHFTIILIHLQHVLLLCRETR